MRSTVACLKLLLFALLCLAAVPAQMLVLCLHRDARLYTIPKLWHRGVCRIFGIRVTKNGAPAETEKKILFASNHLSYLDIPLLGAELNASFVAKQEVKDWPVFGFLAKLQRTVFIDRSLRATSQARDLLKDGLQNTQNLILFPEGTSTDGRAVITFRPSLFSIAFSESGAGRTDMLIQPVSLRLDRVNGTSPGEQEIRDLYAWHRDMTTGLPAHLWRFARSSGADLTLTFHEAIDPGLHADRKTLAHAAHIAVSKGLDII